MNSKRESQHALDLNILSQFYVKHRLGLVSYVTSLVKDRNLAEEFLQEAMLKLLLAAPDFSSEQQAYGYVKKTLNNRVIDFWRMSGKKPQLVSINQPTPEIEKLTQDVSGHDEILMAAEDSAIVRQALSLLSPAQRTALIMWELQGSSTTEIAEELGIKRASVRHTVSRARASLRKILTNLIINEETGATALDLLSRSYVKIQKVTESAGKISFSLVVMVLLYIGKSQFLPDGFIPQENTINQTVSLPSSSPFLGFKQEVNQVKTNNADNQNSKKISLKKSMRESTSRALASESSHLIFAGADANGLPAGFTFADSSDSTGTLAMFGGNASFDDYGVTISSILKNYSGDSRILFTQVIRQEISGLTFDGTLAYARNGHWIPLEFQVRDVSMERLVNGQFLLMATLRIEKEVSSLVKIPTIDGDAGIGPRPSSIFVRAILNADKSKLLAEAIDII